MQVLKQLQIPYSFAKRHGVLLRYEGDQAFILRRDNTSMLALQEARRLLAARKRETALAVRARVRKRQRDQLQRERDRVERREAAERERLARRREPQFSSSSAARSTHAQ